MRAIIEVMTMAVPASRVPTGIPGLDPLIGGGFPAQRAVLLCGGIGTGKTTFGLQFLLDGAARGEAGVMVSVDQKPQHIIEDASRFQWDVAGAIDRGLLTVLDAGPCFTARRGRYGLDARQVASDLTQQIRRTTAKRLVIDGAASLVADGAAGGDVDDFMRAIVASLEASFGCTTLLTANGENDSAPAVASAKRLASGVVSLRIGAAEHDGRPGALIRGRWLLVRKMRGAPASLDEHPFDIVDGRGLLLRDRTSGHDVLSMYPREALQPRGD